jgi:hypothetical protein
MKTIWPYCNTQTELVEFFTGTGRVVDTKEFDRFWRSLSYDERDYYKHVDLKK